MNNQKQIANFVRDFKEAKESDLQQTIFFTEEGEYSGELLQAGCGYSKGVRQINGDFYYEELSENTQEKVDIYLLMIMEKLNEMQRPFGRGNYLAWSFQSIYELIN